MRDRRNVSMKIQPHPHFDRLRRRVAAAETVDAWNGRIYRCVELAWARPEYLISGEGTRKHGSRWMQPGITEVVHAASTEALALRESRAILDYYGIERPRLTPRVSVELEIGLQRVLKLTRAEELLSPYSGEELLSEDWRKLNHQGRESLAQAVGRAAWECHYEGLWVPSVRDRRCRNLIWFPGSLEKESRCEISGQKELEKWITDPHADLQNFD